MRVSFFYLDAFSAVGGIQKFNTNVIKSLHLLALDNKCKVKFISLHDRKEDCPEALKPMLFSACGSKLKFLALSIYHIFSSEVILLGHVNLISPLVFLTKFFADSKTFVFAHGIEIWNRAPYFKRKALSWCTKILAVSNHTAQRAAAVQGISKENFGVCTNVLDPEKTFSIALGKPEFLIKRYGLEPSARVLLSVCRLGYGEKDKGYDKVLGALPDILKKFPTLKYILAGKIEDKEQIRITTLLTQLGIEKSVIVTGFIPDEELVAHYQLCDLFILPSSKEGFGIVFIEATACGKSVISGNADGAREALLNGRTGLIINPYNKEEIAESICKFFNHEWPSNLTDSNQLRALTLENFSFPKMAHNLEFFLLRKDT